MMISQYTDYGRGAGENAYIMAFLLTEYLMVSFVIEGGLWYKMKYGLALGGGGARGAFEAGVWRALSELKKEVTHIAGTSVGAINGAAFAAGVDAGSLWERIRPEHIISGVAGNDMLSAASLCCGYIKGRA